MSVPNPTPIESTPIPPEILEWANQQFTDEEVLEGLRDIQENGGYELREFAHELELPSTPDERPAQ